MCDATVRRLCGVCGMSVVYAPTHLHWFNLNTRVYALIFMDTSCWSRMQHFCWETVDGQKIAPPRKCFWFSMLVFYFLRNSVTCQIVPPPPAFNVVADLCRHMFFLITRRLCPLPSHHLGIPILNLEGGGEVPYCIMMWLVLLVHFGGAKFCPSTVGNI